MRPPWGGSFERRTRRSCTRAVRSCTGRGLERSRLLARRASRALARRGRAPARLRAHDRLTRTPEGLAPTAAADAILPLAEEIEARVHAIARAAAGTDHHIEGTVRLSTSETFAGFVIQRLGELRALHPDLVVEVIAENRVADVARGEADLALRFVTTAHKDLVTRKLADVHWALYASPSYVARHPCASPPDLRGHDVIGYDDSLASTPGATWLAAHTDGAHIVVRGNSMRAVLDAALAGLGLAVLPCHLADPTPLVRISPEVLGSRTLCIVVHPDLAKVARVRAVIDFISDVVTRDRGELLGAR